MNKTFISLIMSLVLISSLSFADMSMKITPNPINVNVNQTVIAEIDVDSTPETSHFVMIEGFICKDTDGNKNTCESYLLNGAGEFKVVFENGLYSTTTDSFGKAKINISLGPSADPNANYFFKVKSNDGGWQEASATGESNDPAIPEFPAPIVPALLSMASFGLISSRMKR